MTYILSSLYYYYLIIIQWIDTILVNRFSNHYPDYQQDQVSPYIFHHDFILPKPLPCYERWQVSFQRDLMKHTWNSIFSCDKLEMKARKPHVLLQWMSSRIHCPKWKETVMIYKLENFYSLTVYNYWKAYSNVKWKKE